jgi:serine/threonine-protein kinase
MFRFLTIALAAVSFTSVVAIVATTPSLPARVATHFAAGGMPNGWMTRDGYLAFTLAFVLGVPWLVYAVSVLLPSRFPHLSNLPNRDYWLAPERIDETIDTLKAFGAGVALAIGVLLGAMHWAILDANAARPVRLAEGPFLAGVLGFAIALLCAVGWLYRRFRKPPGAVR